MLSEETPFSVLEVILESNPLIAATGIPKFWANTSWTASYWLSAEV